MRRLFFVLAVTAALSATMAAAVSRERDPKSAVPAIEAIAVPSAVPMQIDGVFSEEIWTAARPMTAFVQRDPSEGAAPTHSTEVRVAFDNVALYVAVRANEPHTDKIVGHLT